MISYLSDGPVPDAKLDRTRRRVLLAVQAEPFSSLTELSDDLVLSAGSVRLHILALRDAGIVSSRMVRTRRGTAVNLWRSVA